jgi:hypothetical protein
MNEIETNADFCIATERHILIADPCELFRNIKFPANEFFPTC